MFMPTLQRFSKRALESARLAACAAITYSTLVGPTDACVASWYGPGFYGHKTASGEILNQNALTAAHRTLPFGTKVRVHYGSRSVIVRINDRGPFVRGRCIDLSRSAAHSLGLVLGSVSLEILH